MIQSSHLELFIAALVGFVPAIIAILKMRRMGGAEIRELDSRTNSQRADAVDKLSETVVRLSERILDVETEARIQGLAIRNLTIRLERANRLVRLLLRAISVLTTQLTELGATPRFVIPICNDEADIDDLLAKWLHIEEGV